MAVSRTVKGPSSGGVRNPYSSWPNWFYPTAVVVVFSVFVVYAFLVVEPV